MWLLIAWLFSVFYVGSNIFHYVLTHKQLELQRCILNIVATDVLVLKHSADYTIKPLI